MYFSQMQLVSNAHLAALFETQQYIFPIEVYVFSCCFFIIIIIIFFFFFFFFFARYGNCETDYTSV